MELISELMAQPASVSVDRRHLNCSIHNEFTWCGSLISGVTEDYFSITYSGFYYIVDVKLTVISNRDITQILLYTLKCGDECKYVLDKISSNLDHDIWQVRIIVEHYRFLKPFSFRFKIEVEDGRGFFFDAFGVHNYSVGNAKNFKYYIDETSPSWVKSAVFYHIFVDSYKSSTVAHSSLAAGRPGVCDQFEFYGGDIYGIIESMPHLESLGVNVICLTPVFKSSTNHRYDIEDFFKIDDKLGGEHALKQLIEACKKSQIKIIFDGVFNHASNSSNWFKSAINDNNLSQEKFVNFFKFDDYPSKYECFWGEKALPKLNYKSEALRNSIYGDKESVINFWQKKPYGISGWRLDACCMIGKYTDADINAEILTELYSLTKSRNKDCYIFGEIPFDPTEAIPYSTLDGITNYSGFYTPILSWLVNPSILSTEEMDRALREFVALMGHQFTLTSMIFLGNHDKSRFFSLLDCNLNKYMIALTLLFTYSGIPSVYYGDEIGLHDLAVENDSRIGMKWQELNGLNLEIFRITQSLISLRKKSIALQNGLFRALLANENLYVYERFYNNNLIVVILNKESDRFDKITLYLDSLSRLGINKLYSYMSRDIKIEFLEGDIIRLSSVKSFPVIILSSNDIS